ncbi:hypothetical protein BV20DRAFT_25791 [Pilatotrama ljubarskyi]|nr:hypothetical protein BV20DRAFT_25791 [Pilatotrama ljubarskyi]
MARAGTPAVGRPRRQPGSSVLPRAAHAASRSPLACAAPNPVSARRAPRAAAHGIAPESRLRPQVHTTLSSSGSSSSFRCVSVFHTTTHSPPPRALPAPIGRRAPDRPCGDHRERRPTSIRTPKRFSRPLAFEAPPPDLLPFPQFSPLSPALDRAGRGLRGAAQSLTTRGLCPTPEDAAEVAYI